MKYITNTVAISAVFLPLALAAQPMAEPLSLPLVLPYESVFKHYQAHTDVPLRDWKVSNETVRKAGGWRQYLKESQASDAASPTDTTKPNMIDHSNHTPQSIEVKKP